LRRREHHWRRKNDAQAGHSLGELGNDNSPSGRLHPPKWPSDRGGLGDGNHSVKWFFNRADQYAFVAPERAAELMQLLIQATDTAMRHQPDFISANLHLSLDKKRIVNYAQWRSKEDFEAMQSNPAAKPHIEKAASIAERFEPVLYIYRRARRRSRELGMSQHWIGVAS
jgi:quinol monooxygenase YgiN